MNIFFIDKKNAQYLHNYKTLILSTIYEKKYYKNYYPSYNLMKIDK